MKQMKKLLKLLGAIGIFFIFIFAANFLTILLYKAYLDVPIIFYVVSAVMCYILFAIIITVAFDGDC